MAYPQSIPIAARREFLFKLNTAAGGILSGQAFAGAEIQVRKAGGALANAANSGTVSELGATANYVLSFSTGEIDTPGPLFIRINKAGALVVEWVDEVTAALYGTAISGTLTATAFTTSLTSAIDDFYKDGLINFHTGALAGQVKKIGAYAGATKLVTLATINSVQQTFTAAPANTDVFQIVNR